MIRAILLAVLIALPAAADPVLSIDVTMAEGEEFGDAAEAAKALGAKASSLSVMWDEMETDPGRYSPQWDWPLIAGLFFPQLGLDFTLTFSVIDTVEDRRPDDLKDFAWDDPQVIARFTAHADEVLLRLRYLNIIAVSVGNEVDVHLTGDEDAAAYARFLAAARAHILTKRPGIPVGTKLTFVGLTGAPARWQPVMGISDAVFATYYPLGPGFTIRPASDVTGDIGSLLAIAGEKPLWLMEAGYPSEGCGASEQGQREFAAGLSDAAREHGDRIALISWTFFTDLPEEDVDRLSAYYGMAGDDCFGRYLRTLGLRRQDGTAKPAAEAFGWP